MSKNAPSIPPTRLISGLSDIADQYDAILCDAWGVVHNGVALFEGVAEALSKFRAAHGPVLILTNAPRLNNVIPNQLDRLGLPRSAYDGVVTSGDATAKAIEAFDGNQAFRLGPDKDETLFAALDLDFVDIDKADFILCTGLFDDESEHPDDYRELLSEALEAKLPMICANPDIVVKLGDRTIWCGGALAQVYQQMGGEIILCGKPHQPIYDIAYQRLAETAKSRGQETPRKILVIGDGMGTDIRGANEQELDVVFVAEGIFSEEVRDRSGMLDHELLSEALSTHNVFAAYALDGLTW